MHHLILPAGYANSLGMEKKNVAKEKHLPASAKDTGDTGLIPGSEGPLGGGNGNPLQCSCWEIPWTEEPGGPQSMRLQESYTTEHTRTSDTLIVGMNSLEKK